MVWSTKGFETNGSFPENPSHGCFDVVKLIISFPNIDLNKSCGADKTTALHCAASGGSLNVIDVIKVLLEAGADPNIADANGNYPIDVIVVPPKLENIKKALEELLSTNVSESTRTLRVSISTSNSNPNSPPLSPENGSPSFPLDSNSSPDSLKINDVIKKEYPIDPSLPDIKNDIFSTDEFRMFSFKVRPCSRTYSHDWTECPFVHPGENIRRRDPRKYHYSCVPCPDFRKGACRRGDMCEYAHGVFESWLHLAQYRTRICKDGVSCNRRVCFFAHAQEELRPLYVSTGSAVPSPRSASSNAVDFMSLLPNSPLSPLSPSANGMSSIWAQQNVPTLHLPGSNSNFQTSRLRSSLNARRIQRREMKEDGWVREFETAIFSAELRNYIMKNNLRYRKLTCRDSWIFRKPEADTDQHIPEDKAAFGEGLCSYRMNMSLHDYDINTSIKAEEKESVGAVGRVFWSQRIEVTPDVSYYSSEDYPQRELALSCGVRSSVALPVSDSNGHPIGALEIVSQSELDSQFWSRLQESVSSDALKEKGLTCMPVKDLCGHDVLIQSPMSEINDVLKVVDPSHDLVLAQTWLCRSGDVFSLVGSLDFRLEYSSFTCQNGILLAQRFCPLKKGEGVVGNTILSPGLVYCENVAKFSISEYPLAHFARHNNLTTCFAIWLRSTLSGNEVYVLELFLHPSNFNDNKATLISILDSLVHNLRTFEVVSREEVGDKSFMLAVDPRYRFHFETLEITMEKIIVAVVILESQPNNKGKLLGDNSRGKSPIEVIDAELSLQPLSKVNNNVVTEEMIYSTSEKSIIDSSQVGSRKGGIPISLEELQKVSGVKRKEAAANLGVSVSTLKRVCWEYDISREYEGNKDYIALTKEKRDVEETSSHCASTSFRSTSPEETLSPSASTSSESTSSEETSSRYDSTFPEHSSSEEVSSRGTSPSPYTPDGSHVTVKAKYGDNFIKFQLSTYSGIDEFNQQVSKRLQLEVGKYIVIYQDDDNDWIRIDCDDDLQGYLSHSISLGKSTVLLTLELIA